MRGFGELEEGAADLLLRRIARDTQDLIGIIGQSHSPPIAFSIDTSKGPGLFKRQTRAGKRACC